MFDFAWSELAVIAVVALVVIGPKDLPRAMRVVGIWVAKARGMAREFQNSVDQMVREAELDDVKKQIEQASQVDLTREIEKHIDPKGELQETINAPASIETAAPVAEIPSPVEAMPAVEASIETPASLPEEPKPEAVPPLPDAPAVTAKETHTP